jgi:hypothetical protein
MNKYSYLFYLYYYTLNHILRYEIQYLKIWGGTNNASLLSAKCAIRVSQKRTLLASYSPPPHMCMSKRGCV